MRIVIKVGTNLLAPADGSLDKAWIMSLAEEVNAIKRGGIDVVLVTSCSYRCRHGQDGYILTPGFAKGKTGARGHWTADTYERL